MSNKLILSPYNVYSVASVTTEAATSATFYSAVGNGNITNDGSTDILARGFCCSNENSEPTLADFFVTDISTTTGAYSTVIPNLSASTGYFYRAFAQNNRGVSYGNVLSFSTLPSTIGSSFSICISTFNILTTSASTNALSVYDTSSAVDVSRGICYVPDACYAYLHPSLLGPSNILWNGVKNATGPFYTSLTNLIPGETYFWNSFLYRQNEGYIMSINGPYSFTTLTSYAPPKLPTVQTLSPFYVATDSASLEAVVSSVGNSRPTYRGIIISNINSYLILQPTLYDTSILDTVTNEGYYRLTFNGLSPSKRYYYRAFAWNSVGIAYGNVNSFLTPPPPSSPTVYVDSVSSISQVSAIITSNVTDAGGSTAYKGICWMPYVNSVSFPTINDSSLLSGSTGTGSYQLTAAVLDCSTRYAVRAFSYNSYGLSYSNSVSFYTAPCSSAPSAPSVTTESSINTTTTSSTLRGNVTSLGTSTFAYRGICISTGTTPTAFSFPPGINTPYGFFWQVPDSQPNKYIIDSSVGTGLYSLTFNNLTAGTTYYYRAFALNFYGMTYGSTLSFVASSYSSGPPTVITTGGVYNSATNLATLSGSVTSTGNTSTVYRAICVSTGATPLITTDTSILYPTTTGTGAYSCIFSLPRGKTYNYRAYAWNSNGGSYGSTLSLDTGSVGFPTIKTFYSGSSKSENEYCTEIPISSLTYSASDFLLIFFSTRSNGARYWWNSEEGWNNNSKWNVNRYGTNNTNIHTNIGYRIATKTSDDNLRICCAVQSLFGISARATLNYQIYVISGHNVVNVNNDFGTAWYTTMPRYNLGFAYSPPITSDQGLFNITQGRAKHITGYSFSYFSPRLPGWASTAENPYWKYMSRTSNNWLSIMFLSHRHTFTSSGNIYTITPPAQYSNVKYSPSRYYGNATRGHPSIASATNFSTDTSIALDRWIGEFRPDQLIDPATIKDDYVSWGFYIR